MIHPAFLRDCRIKEREVPLLCVLLFAIEAMLAILAEIWIFTADTASVL